MPVASKAALAWIKKGRAVIPIPYGKKAPVTEPAAMERRYTYAWPGYGRERRNCVESMVVLDKDGRIDTEDVPRYVQDPEEAHASTGSKGVSGVNLEETEKEGIRKALAMCEGNREKAAKMLGIGERTLYRKIKRYGFS